VFSSIENYRWISRNFTSSSVHAYYSISRTDYFPPFAPFTCRSCVTLKRYFSSSSWWTGSTPRENAIHAKSRVAGAGDKYFRIFRVRRRLAAPARWAACHKRCLIICRVDVESGVTASEGTWTAPLSIHSVRNALIPAIAASCPANVYDMTVKPRLFCR